MGKVGRVAPVLMSRFVIDCWVCPNLENSTACFKSMPIFIALHDCFCGCVLRFPSRVPVFSGVRVGFL